jgi:hypothetical protein
MRGVAILGMATNNPLERLDLRHEFARAREQGLDDFAPVLTIDGDDGVYGFDSSGAIRHARAGVMSPSDGGDFGDLYEREIAALITRQQRYSNAKPAGS